MSMKKDREALRTVLDDEDHSMTVTPVRIVADSIVDAFIAMVDYAHHNSQKNGEALHKAVDEAVVDVCAFMKEPT
jgi:hypothetical protein